MHELGCNAAEAGRNICISAFEENSVNGRTTSWWFEIFHSRNLNLESRY